MSDIIWSGVQWRVTKDGLLCDDPEYFIEANCLGNTVDIGAYKAADWLLHMSDKTWVNYPDFVEAFDRALKEHAGKFTPLSDDAYQEGVRIGRASAKRR